MSTKTMSPEQVGRMWQIQQELKGLCTILDGLKACALDLCEELENDYAGIPLTPEVQRGFALMQQVLISVGVKPAFEVKVR